MNDKIGQVKEIIINKLFPTRYMTTGEITLNKISEELAKQINDLYTTPENGELLSDEAIEHLNDLMPDSIYGSADDSNDWINDRRYFCNKQLSHCKPLIEARVRRETLIEATTIYGEYIKLLVDELNDLVGIASLHGWKSSRYEDGIRLREKLATLKSGKSVESEEK